MLVGGITCEELDDFLSSHPVRIIDLPFLNPPNLPPLIIDLLLTY
jgi:hypothetical protein